MTRTLQADRTADSGHLNDQLLQPQYAQEHL